MKPSILTTVSIIDQKSIVREYSHGMTLKELSMSYGYSKISIRKILTANGLPIVRSWKDYRKVISIVEEQNIIALYLQKRGIQYIVDKLSISRERVIEILDKYNIPRWSRKDLTKANADFYGPSKGFSGKIHSKKTKQKMSVSQLNNPNRLSTTGPKSRYIETSIGKVQGSYEVAYLQKHFETSGSLPSIGKAVHTPYGTYIPDFDTGVEFVEVKSPFTLEVCKGLRKNQKGIKTDIQYRKIKWVDKNVKPVILVVFESEEAMSLFRKAIKNRQIVNENIVYKNGKYYKEYDPLFTH